MQDKSKLSLGIFSLSNILSVLKNFLSYILGKSDKKSCPTSEQVIGESTKKKFIIAKVVNESIINVTHIYTDLNLKSSEIEKIVRNVKRRLLKSNEILDSGKEAEGDEM